MSVDTVSQSRVCLLIVAASCIGVASGEDFQACRLIDDAAARLACYDVATVPPPPSEAPDLFGLPTDEVRKRAEEQLGQTSPDVLEARIVGLKLLATGKFEVELDNGQRWQQIDTTSIRLTPGDEVRIRRATLGSFLLQRAAGGASVRVRRLADVKPD